MKRLALLALRPGGPLALAAAVLLFGSPSAHAGSCVRLDATRDMLAPEEQKAAVFLFEEALVREGRTVEPSHCTEEWVLSHVRLGNTVTVVVSSPLGRRSDRVSGVEEFPAQYSQSIRALLTRQDPRNEMAAVVDRTNVTTAQVDVKRVESDSIFFLRLGYGATSGPGSGGGPLLGLGWRKELNRIALDLAVANILVLSNGQGDDFSSGPLQESPFTLLALGVNYYFRPLANATPYAGLGLGFTRWGVDGGKGLDVRLSLGYEMFRASTLRVFVQADGILPTYQVTRIEPTDWSDPSRNLATSTFRPVMLAVSLGIGWGGGQDGDHDD